MQFGELKSLLEGKFEPEQVASIMEFALALMQMWDTEERKKIWTNLQALTEKLNAFSESVHRLSENQEELRKIVAELAKGQEELRKTVAQLSQEMIELKNTVAQLSKDQEELKKIVAELIRDQQELKKTVAQLSREMIELKNTVAQLSQEMIELKNTVAKLAKDQEDLRATVAELSKVVESLAESVKKLQEEHKKTREQLGGLSHTVGYILENKAYKHLPRLMKEENIEVIGRLKRGFIEYSEFSYDEVNIFGKAKVDGSEVFIIGESKTQLNKKHIDEFLRKLERVQEYLNAPVIPVMVTHMVASPHTERYARQKGVRIYFSYDFEE